MMGTNFDPSWKFVICLISMATNCTPRQHALRSYAPCTGSTFHYMKLHFFLSSTLPFFHYRGAKSHVWVFIFRYLLILWWQQNGLFIASHSGSSVVLFVFLFSEVMGFCHNYWMFCSFLLWICCYHRSGDGFTREPIHSRLFTDNTGVIVIYFFLF